MGAEVVIVGAGPVGLLLAGELQLHGVRAVVLERLPKPTGFSKAGGLHARSTETMELRGLVGTLRERGRKRFEAVFADNPELLTKMRRGTGLPVPGHFAGIQKLRHDLPGTNHPGLLGIMQADLEEVLTEHALALGAEIRRDHEVVGLEQDEAGVTVHLPGGSLRAGYVVGCDGGRSAVRRLAGFAFDGTEPTTTSRLADLAIPELFDDPGIGHHRTATGYALITPFRVLTTEPGVPADRDAPVAADEIAASISRVVGREIRLPGEPSWMSRFTDATRLAEPYRIGRVLLAGDAAHIHSPAGGQGLNLGLQDAVNLGWKLAAAVAGWAPADLLDTYGAERRPIAERVLHNTRAQTALSTVDPVVTPLRELFAELMELEEVNRYLGEMISGVAVRYDLGPGHPLVGRFLPDPALRKSLHAGRPVLFDPNGDCHAEGWRDRVDIVTAGSEALLVRPDGYIAWAGEESLEAALTRWFGPSAS